MNSAHPMSWASQLRAFLDSILCGGRDTADDSNTQEKPPIRHVPTHAAKSFLKTVTPRRSPLNQAETLSFDSDYAYDISPTVSPPTAVSNTRSQAASLPMTDKHTPSTPWVSSFDFDIPYPRIAGRYKNLRDGERAPSTPRNSVEMTRSRLRSAPVIHSDNWEKRELHIDSVLGIAAIHALRMEVAQDILNKTHFILPRCLSNNVRFCDHFNLKGVSWPNNVTLDACFCRWIYCSSLHWIRGIVFRPDHSTQLSR